MDALFVPRRDAPLFITASGSFFYTLLDSAGKKWCEILVPPKSISMMRNPWPSIVVEPEQVWRLSTDKYFMFWLNSRAVLNLYYKDDSRLSITGSEQAVSEEVLARYLQHAAWVTGHVTSNKDSILTEIFSDYQASGLTMQAFLDQFFTCKA